MTVAETIILAAYFFVLIVLAVYGWHRYYLVFLYMRNRDRQPKAGPPLSPLPVVTIQLPLYNELYVTDRLIDAVAGTEYPRELLEIQVLDDSTDETRNVAEMAVRRWAATGLDIKYLHRTDRSGYKAGALEAGLKEARGEFVAIFDADFIPTSDFLVRLMPHFADPKVAMVQARWGHINEDYSLLTKIQSILLDGHFVLEHGARNRGGCFFNFNGTAGIWRRAAIADAGGWQHDTLTEDLDLSYRAQLRGWRFVFVPDVVVQVAAVPLGQGLDPDLPQAAAAHPALEPPPGRQGGGLLPPHGELQLPADVRVVSDDVPGHGHSLQHGLVRDAAHRRAPVLCSDLLGV
jgi:cellulose synthase/poly-beta-1,6-N-acetylglucosamine synthase-like glycosyltransferase